jgi:hypothetical protein
MSANQYQQEYQVTTIIDTYHRNAIQAEQRRLARPDRPSRSFVRSLVSSARQARVQEPVTVPSDTALIA